MTSTQLKALQDSNLATNNARQITAEKLREVTTELIKKSGGWGDYNNSSATFQTIPGNDEGTIWTKLENNGQGLLTNENYLPYYTTSLFSNDAVDLTNIPEGTVLTVRFDIELSILSNNTDVLFRVKFKNSAGAEVYTSLYDYRAFKITGTLRGVNFYEFYVGSDIVDGSMEIELQCDNEMQALWHGAFITIP
jgi:hypothetical protein